VRGLCRRASCVGRDPGRAYFPLKLAFRFST
jgi:hypothetical protein